MSIRTSHKIFSKEPRKKAALLTHRRPNWLLAGRVPDRYRSFARRGKVAICWGRWWHRLWNWTATLVSAARVLSRAQHSPRAQDFGYGDKADGEGDNGDGQLITVGIANGKWFAALGNCPGRRVIP